MKKFDEMLQDVCGTVGIAGHIRPDGDCVGAVLALQSYVKTIRPDLTVEVYLQSVPERFQIVPGVDTIRTSIEEGKCYDLFFALDCGDTDRLGEAQAYFATARRTVCVDHHISNVGYAQENYIKPDIGSTCEVLYLHMNKESVTKTTATCLYLGMAHDTGMFQYANTTPQTLRIAADLLEYGINHTEIVAKTFYEKTYVQTHVLGRALMESIQIFDGRCVVSVLKQREMRFYGITGEDLEGIVNQLLQIKGMEVAIFLYEVEPDTFKVSMRSRAVVDVAKVALEFGGGGHMRAAGCTISGRYHEVINSLTYFIQKQLEP